MAENAGAPARTATTPDEIGETVADARRLARKATKVFIDYHCGPDNWQTDCIMLTRGAFLRSTKSADASKRMPCRLYQARPDRADLWLAVGR
jgi:hypothetical protein